MCLLLTTPPPVYPVHTIWKYQYRSQCLVPVVEEAFGAKSPSYATILKLDRKIRDFEIPLSLRLGTPILPHPAGGGAGGAGGAGGDGVNGGAGGENGSSRDASSAASLSLSMQRYMLFCEKETSGCSLLPLFSMGVRSLNSLF